jgi:hypothetical protein
MSRRPGAAARCTITTILTIIIIIITITITTLDEPTSRRRSPMRWGHDKFAEKEVTITVTL